MDISFCHHRVPFVGKLLGLLDLYLTVNLLVCHSTKGGRLIIIQYRFIPNVLTSRSVERKKRILSVCLVERTGNFLDLRWCTINENLKTSS